MLAPDISTAERRLYNTITLVWCEDVANAVKDARAIYSLACALGPAFLGRASSG